MNDWARIQPHDTVDLRAKRKIERRTVDVAEILAPVLGDGRGFVGTDGEVYRYFYWDLAIATETPGER